MAFDVSRRWFIGGLASLGAFGGSGLFAVPAGKYSSGKTRLKFGVISDVHIRVSLEGPGLLASHDTTTLERTLAWYRDQGVDAVAVAGDIADRGLVEEMEAFASAWQKVFPDSRAPDGRRVERIVVYGNHDWGGEHYKQFVAEKYPNATDLSDRLLIAKPKEHWERIFNEPWEHVFRKDVKGYAFIAAHWTNGWCKGSAEVGVQGLESFFAGQKGKIDPSLPFFFIQHPHPKNTCYGSYGWGQDSGISTKILSNYSNAVAFSGHSHHTLTDDMSIWQGEFTSLGTSSLRYTGLCTRGIPQGYENSRVGRAGDTLKYDPYKIMKASRYFDGCQGLLVSVYDDSIVFRRRDFLFDGSLGDDWVIPLPAAESKPFAFAAHAKRVAVAEFAPGAKVSVKKTKGKTRGYKKNDVTVPSEVKDAYEIRFPSANAVPGAKALYYEITAVSNVDGRKIVKYVQPKGFYANVTDKRWNDEVKCVIAVDQLLPEGTFRLEVRPVNAFGKTGCAIS